MWTSAVRARTYQTIQWANISFYPVGNIESSTGLAKFPDPYAQSSFTDDDRGGGTKLNQH